MIKNQIEKMKNRSIENSVDLYEKISLKMPSKNYAMFDLLSKLGSEPKLSMLSKDVSSMISEIISSESENIDMLEEILNTIPSHLYQKSFIEILINQGVVVKSSDKNNK
ncbi:hypothetical protein [Chimaeribacter coloradensis]|uniref:hypothetical protein n=1 Tax=Chimaeribacter coloradensis TaxID=2060068 RepID=UPI0011AF1397|nr:hypothetical protein [Chimaeribacter coloradensis]